MADCISGNFHAGDGELRFGRQVHGLVASHRATSTGEGSYGSHSAPGKLMIDQSLDWTNTTGAPLWCTVWFHRPYRSITANAPRRAYLRERWDLESGAAPSAPSLPVSPITEFGGGQGENIAWRFWLHFEESAFYTPYAQLAIDPGEQIRVRYDCRLVTEGGGSVSSISAYARWHDILILASMRPEA